MKTKAYYQLILAAIEDAKVGAGCLRPEDCATVRDEYEALRREVLKRRRRCRK